MPSFEAFCGHPVAIIPVVDQGDGSGTRVKESSEDLLRPYVPRWSTPFSSNSTGIFSEHPTLQSTQTAPIVRRIRRGPRHIGKKPPWMAGFSADQIVVRGHRRSPDPVCQATPAIEETADQRSALGQKG